MKIKKASAKNLKGIAKVAAENFSGLKNQAKATKWVRCNLAAFPRMQYFIAEQKSQVGGYILWMEKGGFREDAVFELEQIAVAKKFQGQGLGTKLISESLTEIKKYLEKRGCRLKAVEVTTGTENRAQNLYKKTLGAEAECVVKNLFRGDEVIMIARFVS